MGFKKGTEGRAGMVSNVYGVYTSNGVYKGEVVGTTPSDIGDHVRATGLVGRRTVIEIDHKLKRFIIR